MGRTVSDEPAGGQSRLGYGAPVALAVATIFLVASLVGDSFLEAAILGLLIASVHPLLVRARSAPGRPAISERRRAWLYGVAGAALAAATFTITHTPTSRPSFIRSPSRLPSARLAGIAST